MSTIPGHVRFGLRQEYWDGLSPEDRALYEEIRPVRQAAWKADVFLHNLESSLASYAKAAEAQGGRLDLVPDFQRGHKWDDRRQVAFVENLIRGISPYILKFNGPSFSSMDSYRGDLNPADVVCIDGLQRLTAVRRFVAGDIRAFGRSYDTLNATEFHPSTKRVQIEMFNFYERADLLQFYLDLNAGGMAHEEAEIERVQGLRNEAQRARDQREATVDKPAEVARPRGRRPR